MEHGVLIAGVSTDKHPANQRLVGEKVRMIIDWIVSEQIKQADFSYLYRTRRVYL